MTSHSLQRFLHKPWTEKLTTVEFLIRQNLAKLPYFPVPVTLKINAEEQVRFWWSYLPRYFSEDLSFFEYWGQDAGDLRFLWKTLQPGGTFFDVGAYHGVYSVVAGKRVTNRGRVVAFEPSPRHRKRLQLHLRWNGIRSAQVESYAAGAAAMKTTFFQVVSGDPTRNGLRPPATDDSTARIPVETITLDQYVAEKGVEQVDVMKLDVEGGELEALRGAAKLFERFRPVLICEVLDETTNVWGYKAREIVEYVNATGYRWFECANDGTLVPHEARESYPVVKNYVAMPKEKLSPV